MPVRLRWVTGCGDSCGPILTGELPYTSYRSPCNRGADIGGIVSLIAIRVKIVGGGPPRDRAKPTRSEKVEVGVIFDFQCGKTPDVYPLRYMEDFSTL
jgi:hypothetical protein